MTSFYTLYAPTISDNFMISYAHQETCVWNNSYGKLCKIHWIKQVILSFLHNVAHSGGPSLYSPPPYNHPFFYNSLPPDIGKFVKPPFYSSVISSPTAFTSVLPYLSRSCSIFSELRST